VREPAPTRKLVSYATLAGIGLLAAVVFGNVAIVALAAPFGFALAIGLLNDVPRLPEVRLSIDTSQVVEGDRATIAVRITARQATPRCDVTLKFPAGLRPDGPTGWSLRLRPGSDTVIDVPVTATAYGRFVIGPATTAVPGSFGILARSGSSGERLELFARPKAETLQTLVRAHEVRATAGDRLARRAGDGIEFAEVRRYAPGTPGRLNWRVTARRGEPFVNLRHPERSTDLILLLDTFSAAALPRQVRAAAGMAGAYLARHDRVGLVAFGGVLHWIEPAMGRAQLERLVAALTATQWHHSYAWKSAEIIPSRTLPPTGLVVAISPLEDARMLNALATIRARGVDLAVIETVGDPAKPRTKAGDLAARVINLERVGMRENFRRRGVPVISWREDESLEIPLHALAAWRRRARRRTSR